MSATATYLDYEPRGAARALFDCRELEVLYEGPSGTGKTRAVLEYVYWCCETFPGIRVLLVRETRESMSESVLKTWEENVLPGGTSHACVYGEAERGSRKFYLWPWARNVVGGKVYEGQSRVVCRGLNKPEDLYSTDFDLVVLCEARQIPFLSYQKFLRCTRNKKMPWQQIIADTNPAHERHWLNLRADETNPENGRPFMHRLKGKHSDNPTFTESDLARLQRLRGADREELLEGNWSSGEGMVWPQFHYSTHVIHTTLERKPDGFWHVVPKYEGQACGDAPIRINWTIAAEDWGFRVPGCVAVWGMDADHRMYRLAEYYQREKTIDWWAAKDEDLYFEFNLHRIVCDHDPGSIQKLNDRISPQGGRKGTRIAIPADKEVDAGLSLVRDLLAPGKDGKPSMFFCADTVREKQVELKEEGLPQCTEDEIGGYIFPSKTDLDATRERPDPRCPDHGCDQTRYAAMFVWGKDRTPAPPKPEYDPRTYGYAYGDAENPKRGDKHLRRMGW